MMVREALPEDEGKLKEFLASQGFSYEFPSEDDLLSVRVLLDEDGEIQMACAALPTVEVFLLLNRKWRTPKWRLEALKMVHEDMRQELKSRGIIEAHCWMPPHIARRFGQRLMDCFGWVRPLWTSFAIRL